MFKTHLEILREHQEAVATVNKLKEMRRKNHIREGEAAQVKMASGEIVMMNYQGEVEHLLVVPEDQVMRARHLIYKEPKKETRVAKIMKKLL